MELDRVKNVGRATTMKLQAASRGSCITGYGDFCRIYKNTSPRTENAGVNLVYDVVIPLRCWFGFADDYLKLIMNGKHEIIMNLAR